MTELELAEGWVEAELADEFPELGLVHAVLEARPRRSPPHVEERLRALGVIKALEAAGFEPGDDVEIGGIVFELDPGAPFG